ncbi:glycosyltransferase family 2 protein [Burkholderia multivorans]|uniref:glycosyltransferase family 2 protein n=1 Tax=Burkholderia multivorans TaxID=87883 RepID=UPI001C24B1D1|nr:glycosyltransferase family 2 protein [Burkholderia multivorans]MBU9662038.1 glycosyltransferase family 2 protein [Burkholderia multivorans]
MTGNTDAWVIDRDEQLHLKPWVRSVAQPVSLVAITRVRNESLLLGDTLDHVAEFADVIFVYDDASTDDTLDIAMKHPAVAAVVQNRRWRPGTHERLHSETRHRGLLVNLAKQHFIPDWFFCFDADERYIGPIREFVRMPTAPDLNGIRVRLFDAYMTENDSAPIVRGKCLMDFRRNFGPEYRDILMLWKNKNGARYVGLDSREPTIEGRSEVMFYCQHYGKSLSIDQWEATCRYYIDHFPYEPYGKKWSERVGKAIHKTSDFGRTLRTWGPELFGHAVAL